MEAWYISSAWNELEGCEERGTMVVLYCIKVAVYGVQHLEQYFSYIVAASFIGGGIRSIGRKPLTCHKSMTNFIYIVLRYTYRHKYNINKFIVLYVKYNYVNTNK